MKDGAVEDRPQAGGYRETLLDGRNALAIQLFAGVATAVATALWAVPVAIKNCAKLDRPQVRTPDGFVPRRTGGYKIS